MDYVATPANAKLVRALPGIGWVTIAGAPGAAPMMAAPFMTVMGMVCAAASADWDDVLIAPFLGMSELLAEVTENFLSRCADALASLGVLDRTYLFNDDFMNAYEAALAHVPSPSPFAIAAVDMVERTPFATGGSPFVPAVAGAPMIPAAPPRPMVAAVPMVPAVAAIPAVPGTPLIPAYAGRQARGS